MQLNSQEALDLARETIKEFGNWDAVRAAATQRAPDGVLIVPSHPVTGDLRGKELAPKR